MAAGELVYPGDPFGLGVRDRDAMTSVYITDDDTNLRIVSVNSVSGVVIGLSGLRIDDKGVPQPIDELHTPNTNRTTKTDDFGIGKGTVLRVTAFAVSGTPLVGQTYIMVQLVRGVSGPRRVITTLIAGYVTAVQALGFPGSPIVSSTEGEPAIVEYVHAAPPVGAEQVIVVPTGARWEPQALFTVLTTSGVAGTRVPVFGFTNPFAGAIGSVWPTPGLTPGIAWQISLLPGVQRDGSVIPVRVQAPMPQGLRLLAGGFINTVTLNMDGADQYSALNLSVREWLEVSA